MNCQTAATMATSATPIAIREAQVSGHKLISRGNGISTRPATGSFAIGLTSAKGCLRLHVPAAAAVADRHRAEQAAKLRRRLFGRAERQHGNAELARPGEHALQPRLGSLHDALSHAIAADLELDL